jgi:hypothetical protein
MPYLNVQLARPKLISAPIFRKAEAMEQHITTYVSDFTKPRYKEPVCFMVRADIQFDIYHLYAWSYKLSKQVYYGVACIPNYKTSVMMNGMFRKIRENTNLDYIEESDDEEDFQNNAEDKYVDLEKKVNMICTFHWKFKKWVPVRVSEPRAKLVVIEELSKDSNQRPMNNHQKQNMHSRHPRNQGPSHRPPFKKIYA